MSRILFRLTRAAPVPVFPIVGWGGRTSAQDLHLSARVRVHDSPRPAQVLLVFGQLPYPLLRPALRVHDQMSHPRLTVCQRQEGTRDHPSRLFPASVSVGPNEDLVDAVCAHHADLLSGARASESPIQPDVPPRPWRGVGPHGQGGEGMAGGQPYGRPLPERAPARDGLELDELLLRIGPFFPPLPPGLMLDLRVQGDVIQEARVLENPFAAGGAVSEDAFDRALAGAEPVRLAELEILRARQHLRWLAQALRLQGLDALASRTLRLALAATPEHLPHVQRLVNWLQRSRTVSAALRGVGHLSASSLDERAGPVSRASGIDVDARSEDPEYRSLGFEPIVQSEGDAWARWRQRMSEAVQALELAGRAGDRTVASRGQVEGPRGTLTAQSMEASGPLLRGLSDWLPGLEWGDAMATIVSLDLDLEEMASRPRDGAGAEEKAG